MFKELSEELSSIEMIQSETKDTLIKIKNNLQGSKCRMDEAENQINDLEHKEERNKSEQEKKVPSQNEDRVSCLWTLQAFQHSHHRRA